MIENKLLPSICLIEITGSSVEAIIPDDFGISKIVVASETMDDISAHQALLEVFDLLNETEIECEFNPDFFPSLPKIELTEEQYLQKENIDQYNESTYREGESRAVVVSRFFDPAGDHVVIRMASKSNEIVGRVVTDPHFYVSEKIISEIDKSKSFIDYRDTATLRIH